MAALLNNDNGGTSIFWQPVENANQFFKVLTTEYRITRLAHEIVEGDTTMYRRVERMNILVVGTQGAGKSSLVNGLYTSVRKLTRNAKEVIVVCPVAPNVASQNVITSMGLVYHLFLKAGDMPVYIWDARGTTLESQVAELLQMSRGSVKPGVIQREGDLSTLVADMRPIKSDLDSFMDVIVLVASGPELLRKDSHELRQLTTFKDALAMSGKMLVVAVTKVDLLTEEVCGFDPYSASEWACRTGFNETYPVVNLTNQNFDDERVNLLLARLTKGMIRQAEMSLLTAPVGDLDRLKERSKQAITNIKKQPYEGILGALVFLVISLVLYIILH